MKERPILMSGPLVRESLAGNKTQTRRPIKNEHLIKMPDHWQLTGNGELWDTEPFPHFEFDEISTGHIMHERSKYGKPGDQLWVREAFSEVAKDRFVYRADQPDGKHPLSPDWKWSPSIFMPRKACRLLLDVEKIRVERLWDISEQDAKAEGVEKGRVVGFGKIGQETYREGFFIKWMEIYGVNAFKTKPWVWAIKCKIMEQ